MKTMMRPGLALYGVIPDFDPQFEPQEPPSMTAARSQLHPVMQWEDTRGGGALDFCRRSGGFTTELCRNRTDAAGAGGRRLRDGLDRRFGTASACWSTERALPLSAASAWIWQWWT